MDSKFDIVQTPNELPFSWLIDFQLKDNRYIERIMLIPFCNFLFVV